MKLDLYYSPGACSLVPHAILQSAEIPCNLKLVSLRNHEQNSPEFKQLNPNGQVPVLVINSSDVLTQVVAITLFLDHHFPNAQIFPNDIWKKAKLVELLVWFNNTCHPTFTRYYRPEKFVDGDAQKTDLKAKARQDYQQLIVQIENKVQINQANGQVFFHPYKPGPVDFYALTLTRWATMAKIPTTEFPVLWEYVRQVATAPGCYQALEKEGILDSFK
ncbi:MAG: glutathione S-transferase N-terminal domain-containing protein [Gammaproteobacteria bacterium]|nr:glutathione S-transferase N-terminal domain-containing protein [Gammaproteobacteria bacterium]